MTLDNISYKYPVGCLVVAAICLVSFLAIGLNNSYEWFGRGGAAITLFGVAAEYSLLQIQTLYLSERFRGVGTLSGGVIDTFSVPNPFSRIQMLAHITVVLGTLIWGFGDWFLEWVLCSA